MTSVVLTGLCFLVAIFSLVWLIQLRTRNAGLVDAVWSWSLGTLALLYACGGTAPEPLRWLLAVMGGVWGFRLGTHLFIRNLGRPEDGRYARFRDAWGAKANRNLFWFFQLQAAFSILLSAAFLVPAFRTDAPATAWLIAAIAIWVISVSGESLADWQLEQFKKDPASKTQVCRRGLWHYSRHPNYFFECLHWVSYVPLAIGSPWWWVTLAPPLIMAFLLLKLSGVPLTEAQSAKSRPGYAEYIRITSVLIPLPPKK